VEFVLKDRALFGDGELTGAGNADKEAFKAA
jgi:hypothetical protein